MRIGVSPSDAAAPVVQLSASNGDQLLLYDVPLSWDQGQTFCQRRGGNLASFGTTADMDRLAVAAALYYRTRVGSTVPRRQFWTGLADRGGGEGGWGQGGRRSDEREQQRKGSLHGPGLYRSLSWARCVAW